MDESKQVDLFLPDVRSKREQNKETKERGRKQEKYKEKMRGVSELVIVGVSN